MTHKPVKLKENKIKGHNMTIYKIYWMHRESKKIITFFFSLKPTKRTHMLIWCFLSSYFSHPHVQQLCQA